MLYKMKVNVYKFEYEMRSETTTLSITAVDDKQAVEFAEQIATSYEQQYDIPVRFEYKATQ